MSAGPVGAVPSEAPLLRARGVGKWFPTPDRRRLPALNDVDLDVHSGECLALVGESGCGKTTLGRCLVRQLVPDSGCVEHRGVDLSTLHGRDLRRRRRRLQLVFQDASQAFDPRLRIRASLVEALRTPDGSIPGSADGITSTNDAVEDALVDMPAEFLRLVDLPAALLDRFPHQLSGGQRQRLGIARALAADPELIVLDEPVSALDADVRLRILDLLADLRARLGLTLVFIGHHLDDVRRLADRVAVLYLGRIVEIGPTDRVLQAPRHPYTAALLAAAPSLHRALSGDTGARQVLAGEVPSAVSPPPGCAFHPRCPHTSERCTQELPQLHDGMEVDEGAPTERLAACHHPL